jgi:hypothetical protein
VSLSPEDAVTLYDLVEKAGLANTQVVVSGGGQEMAQPQKPRQPQYGEAWQGGGGYYPRDPFGWQRGPGWGRTSTLVPGAARALVPRTGILRSRIGGYLIRGPSAFFHA